MTNRLLLLIIALLLICYQAIGDDEIKWGQPANGLRIGIESPVTSITSDQSLRSHL